MRETHQNGRGLPLPIKIQAMKRVMITLGKHRAIILRAEPNYRNDIGTAISCIRRGKSWYTSGEPGIKELRVSLSTLKLKDIEKLVTAHFGEDWRDAEDLLYLKELLEREELETSQVHVEEDVANYCQCIDDDSGRFV